MKHSPGPWGISFEGVAASLPTIGIGTRQRDHRVDPARRDANARLIAAAPDLLKALKRLCDGDDKGTVGPSAWDEARNAVAKAEGGTP